MHFGIDSITSFSTPKSYHSSTLPVGRVERLVSGHVFTLLLTQVTEEVITCVIMAGREMFQAANRRSCYADTPAVKRTRRRPTVGADGRFSPMERIRSAIILGQIPMGLVDWRSD